MQIALEELVARLPDLALRDETVHRMPSTMLLGAQTLPITFRAGARQS